MLAWDVDYASVLAVRRESDGRSVCRLLIMPVVWLIPLLGVVRRTMQIWPDQGVPKPITRAISRMPQAELHDSDQLGLWRPIRSTRGWGKGASPHDRPRM